VVGTWSGSLGHCAFEVLKYREEIWLREMYIVGEFAVQVVVGGELGIEVVVGRVLYESGGGSWL
jgi:hypothetical protein